MKVEIPDWAVMSEDKLIETARREAGSLRSRSMGRSQELGGAYLLDQLVNRIEELEAALKEDKL